MAVRWLKRMKEKYVVSSNAVALERLLRRQRAEYKGDPYEEQRKAARAHLERRKIHEPKRLRRNGE